MNKVPVIDEKLAISQLGSRELFLALIGSFEEDSLRQELIGLKVALEEADYWNVRHHVLSIQGGASYIQALRVSSLAGEIKKDIETQSCEGLLVHYPQFIQQCMILSAYIRDYAFKVQDPGLVRLITEVDLPLAHPFRFDYSRPTQKR